MPAGGEFSAVLLSEQSRMSREDVFDAMQHWRALRDAGVTIITCQRGELDFGNLGGMITAIVDQYGAREESVKLAQRVTSGLRLRALQGHRVGGVVFGYDRLVYDETGREVRRVHFRERFRKPPTWRTRIVPSRDRAAVKAVQRAFESIRAGANLCEIVRALNEQGLLSIHGKPFSISSLRKLLRNPTYAGTLRVGKFARGKFARVAERDWIVVEQAHEPIVSRELFDAVQQILDQRFADRPHHHPQKYLLSQIVVCGHCGLRLQGVFKKLGGNGARFYHCNPNAMTTPHSPDCPHPSVRSEKLEPFVLEQVRQRLLQGAAEQRVRDAIIRAKRPTKQAARADERKLAELRQKIERGTENLALASREDFAAIARLIEGWREAERTLAARIAERGRELEPLPEALRVLARYSQLTGQLAQADRRLLSQALRKTITRITMEVHPRRSGEMKFRELTGRLEFHEAFGIPPIEIPDEVLGQRKVWREIGGLARRLPRPVRLADVCALIPVHDPAHASHHLRQAVRAGVVRKVLPAGGWVPATPATAPL